MGGLHDFDVREDDWESMVHGQFVVARRGGAYKIAGAPRVNDGYIVVGGYGGEN